MSSGASAPRFPQFGPLCACHAPTSWWRASDAAAATAEGPRRDAPKLLNTFTRTKVPFQPLEGNRVGWYICGPTVYDSAHMGHARNYVNFDVLRRVMTDYFRYDVRFVMNVTDIDDKIIMRAHLRRSEAVLKLADERIAAGSPGASDAIAAASAALRDHLASGEKRLGDQDRLTRDLATLVSDPDAATWSIQTAYLDLAHAFEAEFMEDMRLVGVQRPDMLTRVSEYTDKIVAYIQQIVDRGYAYASNGSVYFDVPAFEGAPNHKYAKLNKSALENVELAMDGEGALVSDASEKRAENDFVLWKKSKPGEPEWDSPWGRGRPGWHIECSAMCSDVLGERVDVNGGGIDLSFPHHENQLAQSEAFYDCEQWVNHFVHTGHLHIDGLKMSKSLKNFITIRASLEMYTARQIRFLFLLHQWSDPMDLTPVQEGERVVGFKQMEQAAAIEKVFAEFFHRAKGAMRDCPGGYRVDAEHTWGAHERALSAAIDEARKNVHAAMLDNINTPGVVKALKELVGAANVYLGAAPARDVRHLLVDAAARYVTTILGCLGVVGRPPKDGVGFGELTEFGGGEGEGGDQTRAEAMAPALDVVSAFRDEIRALAKSGASSGAILAACDRLRDEGLPAIGVKLDDRAEGGALWKLEGVEALRREREREAEAREKRAAEQRAKKEEAARKLAEKEAAARTSPDEMFKTGAYEGMFSEFDEEGVPTKTKEGEELPKAQRKKFAKLRAAQKKDHDKWLAKQAGDAGDAVEKMAV